MLSTLDLWLPIIVSAVGVFIVSSVVHMVIPLHKSDTRSIPREDGVLDAMRQINLEPGDYMFPACSSMKDIQNPEFIAKCERGPVGFLTVLPNGVWNMGRSLLQWFVFSLGVSLCTAYLASFTLTVGQTDSVLRLTSTVAFMGYGLGVVPNSIWKGTRWSTTLKFLFDGLLYGLTTGLVFLWLWPDAM